MNTEAILTKVKSIEEHWVGLKPPKTFNLNHREQVWYLISTLREMLDLVKRTDEARERAAKEVRRYEIKLEEFQRTQVVTRG